MQRSLFVLSLLGTGLLPGIAAASVDARITASRTSCVSPCPVIFTAEGTTSSQTEVPWHELGYHFDFGDPGAGTWDTTGLTKERQTGGPMAIHTFECEEGQCVFAVGVQAMDASGEQDEAWLEVTVDAPTFRYAASDTLCVSSSGSFFESGDDLPCPEGAQTAREMPEVGSFSGRRVLLRRGESFGSACVGFEESTVLLESFGRSADAQPELEGVELGVAGRCGDNIPTSTQAQGYGDVWASDLTVFDVRTPHVYMGMSYRDIAVVGADLDYAEQPAGGRVTLSESGRICTTQEGLDCGLVPYPHGAYLVESTIIGSRVDPPGINIGAFDCPMLNWVGVAGNVVERAIEHNFRSQGHWRGVWMHNDFRGQHLAAGKQKLTIRGAGVLDYEPVGFRGDHPECTVSGTGNTSRYGLVADNLLGNANSTGDDGFKTGAHPQNAQSVEGLEDIIFERNTFVDIPGTETTDINLAGRNLTCRADNHWSNPDNTNRHCRTGVDMQLPEAFRGPYFDHQEPPAVPDAPVRPPGVGDSPGGSCNCRAGSDDPPVGLGAFLILGLWARRRRSRLADPCRVC